MLMKTETCPAWKFWGITMTMNLADFCEVTDFVDGGWTEAGRIERIRIYHVWM